MDAMQNTSVNLKIGTLVSVLWAQTLYRGTYESNHMDASVQNGLFIPLEVGIILNISIIKEEDNRASLYKQVNGDILVLTNNSLVGWVNINRVVELENMYENKLLKR